MPAVRTYKVVQVREIEVKAISLLDACAAANQEFNRDGDEGKHFGVKETSLKAKIKE